MAFAKFRPSFRRIGAQTIDALCKNIGDVCALYPGRECWNYLQDTDYWLGFRFRLDSYDRLFLT